MQKARRIRLVRNREEEIQMAGEMLNMLEAMLLGFSAFLREKNRTHEQLERYCQGLAVAGEHCIDTIRHFHHGTMLAGCACHWEEEETKI